MAAYFAFYGIGDAKLTGAGEPERLTAVPVTGNFFPVLGVQPGLFIREGIAAARHADYRLVSPNDPAAPGEAVLLFGTGLGGLDGSPGTGNGAPPAPLYRTAAVPQVTASGRPA